MNDFASIFESHYFSNHHNHAQEVEAKLENKFAGYECVTFSSLGALVTSVAFEFCVNNMFLVNVSRSEETYCSIDGMNRFLHVATGIQITKSSENLDHLIADNLPLNLNPDLLLIEGDICRAALVDMRHCHPMLESSGIFVTNNAGLAERIRWARSSYGRRGDAVVNIAANGRLSEFQAMLFNNSI